MKRKPTSARTCLTTKSGSSTLIFPFWMGSLGSRNCQSKRPTRKPPSSRSISWRKFLKIRIKNLPISSHKSQWLSNGSKIKASISGKSNNKSTKMPKSQLSLVSSSSPQNPKPNQLPLHLLISSLPFSCPKHKHWPDLLQSYSKNSSTNKSKFASTGKPSNRWSFAKQKTTSGTSCSTRSTNPIRVTKRASTNPCSIIFHFRGIQKDWVIKQEKISTLTLWKALPRNSSTIVMKTIKYLRSIRGKETFKFLKGWKRSSHFGKSFSCI